MKTLRPNTMYRLPGIIVISAMLLSGCGKPAHFADRLVEGSSLNRSNETVSRQADVKEILRTVRQIFAAIEQKDLSPMAGLVHAEKGVWVDLKAERTAENFTADLADPTGYVNTYYLHTDALRKRTGEPDQKSLFDLIGESEQIRAELFFQGDECEVRLTIAKPEKLESQSYRFNNAYFLKLDGRWYLYRLF